MGVSPGGGADEREEREGAETKRADEGEDEEALFAGASLPEVVGGGPAVPAFGYDKRHTTAGCFETTLRTPK